MDLLWIEVVLFYIGMIWNVIYDVFFSNLVLFVKLMFLIYVDVFKL